MGSGFVSRLLSMHPSMARGLIAATKGNSQRGETADGVLIWLSALGRERHLPVYPGEGPGWCARVSSA